MRRRPISLALRLTVSIGAVITAVLLVFGWMVERSINQHFVQQDVDELRAVVQALQHSLATLPPDLSPPELSERFAQAISGHHSAQYRIASVNGDRIFSSPGASLGEFARSVAPVTHIAADTVSVWKNSGQNLRGAVLRVDGGSIPGPLTLAVATDIDFHLHYLDDFRDYLRIVTVAACLIAILSIWVAVYQGHAPIRRISKEMRRIGSAQLDRRLDTREVPAELAELVHSFNGMIGRLEEVFRRLSDFSGDIAHELRSPITNLKIQTEVGLSQARSVEQYREILYSNLEEYERMAKMVSDMLFLAQADNKLLKPEFVTIDLQAELLSLCDYFGVLAEEQGIALQIEGRQVCILGDRLMIRRAISNLLSNAIRYTPAGGIVTLSCEQTANSAALGVENPGPMIAAAHLAHIFERFYRPDASRQRSGEGAGLGLAIVKSIAEAHGGTISASSSPQSTRFDMTLPAVSCDLPADAARAGLSS